MWIALATLLMACDSTSPETASQMNYEKKVDTIFKAFDGPDLPGAAVAVWKDGEIVFSKGYGSANLEYGIPVQPDETIFHVASVSKQFTVYAVKLMEAEGKLKLDDPIRDYVSEVPDFGTPVTLRHLASHTSGMRDQWDLLYLAGWRLDDVITVDHILKLVERQEDLNFVPGAEYTYCNTGFTLLAETVARVSGMSFAEFCQQHIFEPLGMAHTLFYDDHEKIVPNRAYSYYHDEEVLKKGVLSFANAGATSLFTTAEDLVVWAHHLNNPPDAKTAKIVNEMNTLAVLNNGETFGGAYGQFVRDYKGLQQISHGGADAGYRSYLGRFPEQDFAVAVVSNYADSGPNALALQVADVFLADALAEAAETAGAEGEDEDIGDSQGPDAGLQEEAPAITLDEAALKAFEGYYWMEEENTYRRIVLKDGELVYTRPGSSNTRLAPISAHEFKMLEVPVYAVVTFTEEDGERLMTYSDRSEEVTVMRQFDFREPDAAALARYTGTYYSPELDTSYEMVVEDGELKARHSRHPDFSLTYLRDNHFTNGWTNIQFQTGAGGAPNGMFITTGRTRNLKLRKQ